MPPIHHYTLIERNHPYYKSVVGKDFRRGSPKNRQQLPSFHILRHSRGILVFLDRVDSQNSGTRHWLSLILNNDNNSLRWGWHAMLHPTSIKRLKEAILRGSFWGLSMTDKHGPSSNDERVRSCWWPCFCQRRKSDCREQNSISCREKQRLAETRLLVQLCLKNCCTLPSSRLESAFFLWLY